MNIDTHCNDNDMSPTSKSPIWKPGWTESVQWHTSFGTLGTTKQTSKAQQHLTDVQCLIATSTRHIPHDLQACTCLYAREPWKTTSQPVPHMYISRMGYRPESQALDPRFKILGSDTYTYTLWYLVFWNASDNNPTRRDYISTRPKSGHMSKTVRLPLWLPQVSM